MKNVITLFILALSCAVSAQNKFELNNDLDKEEIGYLDEIPVDSLSYREMHDAINEFLDDTDYNLSDLPTKTNGRKLDFVFNATGQKSELGSSYHYRFSAILQIELDNGKVVVSMHHFKKKSSPGEPGMDLESYIENYEPKVSSKKSRDKSDRRLDEIEIQIHEKVTELMEAVREMIKEAS